MIRSDKLRKSARGQDCTLQIPVVCNRDPATTVLAHRRQVHRERLAAHRDALHREKAARGIA